MMPAIGVDEKISEILSTLLCYREPDVEDVQCAIDGVLRLIEEARAEEAATNLTENDRAVAAAIGAAKEGMRKACLDIVEGWILPISHGGRSESDAVSRTAQKMARKIRLIPD